MKWFSVFVANCILLVLQSVAAQSVECETSYSSLEPSSEDYKPLEVVSLVSVIANPEEFHGKRISVVGAFQLYYDRMSLYLTSEHLQEDEPRSMIYANWPDCAGFDEAEVMSEWRGKFVRIIGVFNSNLGQFSAGTLENVEKVSEW